MPIPAHLKAALDRIAAEKKNGTNTDPQAAVARFSSSW